MFGIRVFSIGLLLGLVGGIFITHFHVLRTKDGFTVVARVNQPPLRSTYCDVREWSGAMWANHPEVTAALTASGRSKLIGQSLLDDAKHGILPESSEKAPVIDSSVARRNPPIRTNSGSIESHDAAAVATTSKAGSQWLDQKSVLRQQWESMVEETVAPVVEESQTDSVTTNTHAPEGLIQQLNEKFGSASPASASPATRQPASPAPPPRPSTDGVPPDLLQQVIPQTGQFPRSAAPIRNLGQQFR